MVVSLLTNFISHVARPQPVFASKVRSLSRFYYRAAPPLMAAAHKNSGDTSYATFRYSPAVDNMQEFLHSNPSDGWERCWEEGLTPWDLGKPTPILQQLLQTESLPKGRVLIPGCGSGYDVVTLASSNRYVVGMDLSEVAIKKAKELAASSPNGNYCSFLQADFFTWEPTQLFDLIFDYTFFCAIVPDKRAAWASRMSHLLKPDGELITLMFPIDDHDGGPPYKTSVADYEDVLHPQGFHAISIVENELAVNPRKGREKLGRWRKMTTVSPL